MTQAVIVLQPASRFTFRGIESVLADSPHRLKPASGFPPRTDSGFRRNDVAQLTRRPFTNPVPRQTIYGRGSTPLIILSESRADARTAMHNVCAGVIPLQREMPKAIGCAYFAPSLGVLSVASTAASAVASPAMTSSRSTSMMMVSWANGPLRPYASSGFR